jgi:hypothetical protein
LRLLLDSSQLDFPVTELVQRIGVGSNSGATCVIESANKTVDPNLGFEIVEVYVSNISQPFSDLEDLVVNYGTDANGNALIFQEKIIAALSGITIDPHNQGLLYNTGDPVVITGGLEANDPQAQKAVAYVGNVSTGSVVSINVIFGGYNYRFEPNTEVTFVNAPGSNGSGAQAVVTSLDVANATYLLVNTDCLEYKAQAVIGGGSYGFTANVNANANCQFQNAFSYANLEFAPIKTMTVTQGGGGYKRAPTVQFEVVYYTDLCNDLSNAASTAALANSVQNIDDLGIFAHVSVLNGGTNYSTTKDKIYCNTAIGYAANFSFTTNATGTVTGVTIVNPGCGYIDIPNTGLYFANSNNPNLAANGSNAQLMAYGYGQGANVVLGVNQIGQIIDFDLVNRGFDYVSTPTISLRIQDVAINALGQNQVPLADAVIYQGANTTVATYKANVDSLSSNNILRLYNYKGALNVYQNLVMTLTSLNTINVTVNTAAPIDLQTYGNGLAKANAIFLNGLIQYPGFYLGTDGFLSADKYLQDSNTYHNFSYQIVVEKALGAYKAALMKIAHPAGTSMLGIYVIPATGSVNPAFSSNIAYISPLTGNVTPNIYTANIVGHGTTFGPGGANVQVGDMILIEDPAHQTIAKMITGIQSNTQLNVESNVQFTFANLVSVTSGSNVVTGQSSFSGIIANNDIVLIRVANTVTTSLVNGGTPGGNSFSVNTVFAANATNVVLSVLPVMTNVSYQIVSSAAR